MRVSKVLQDIVRKRVIHAPEGDVNLVSHETIQHEDESSDEPEIRIERRKNRSIQSLDDRVEDQLRILGDF